MQYLSWFTYIQLVLLYGLQLYWFWAILKVTINTLSGKPHTKHKKEE